MDDKGYSYSREPDPIFSTGRLSTGRLSLVWHVWFTTLRLYTAIDKGTDKPGACLVSSVRSVRVRPVMTP